MLSKNKIKLIKSLDLKKNRDDLGLFVVEGDKLVTEMISSTIGINYLAATEEWFAKNSLLNISQVYEKTVVNKDELIKASLLKSPQNAICVAEIPQYTFHVSDLSDKLSIALDQVQDPGNLGTIIRTADWFGIENIICSHDSVDPFNPKVVQSTMGAISRVHVHCQRLQDILPLIQKIQIPVFGTSLEGENMYQCALPPYGIILMGNESRGIHPVYHPYMTKILRIPDYPVWQKHSESLNVAIATGIICSEFRRRECN